MKFTPLQNGSNLFFADHNPYRAMAGTHGVAELRVAKGEYQLFVSQTNYLTFALPVEVTANMTTRAEFDLEPVPERN